MLLFSIFLLCFFFQQVHSKTHGICVECGSIVEVEKLLIHVLKQHQTKKWLCSICGEDRNTRTLLNVHMATYHSSNKIMCDICGKSFSHEVRLQQHKFQYHKHNDNPEKTTCKVCGKRLKSMHALYKHRRTHSKVKPYWCSLCKFNTLEKGNAILHLKNVHKKTDIEEGDVIKIGNIEF